MKVVVAQKGAREHFLAARALHRTGALAQLVVDWYPPVGGGLATALEGLRWGGFSRAFGGRTRALDGARVTPLYGCRLRSVGRQVAARLNGRVHEATLRDDADFARTVSRTQLASHDVFFAYSYACLDALQAERARGKICILDQIDPGEKEHELIREEEARWPRYARHPYSVPPEYFDRLRWEWQSAHAIIVNSEWSKQCVVGKGAPAEKIEVLPLAYERTTPSAPPPAVRNGKARVLWLGRVTLQKGIPYLLEAAQLLKDEPVEFMVGGEMGITERAARTAPANVHWLGKITAQHKAELYRSSTVFVLPTLSDGFAITQLEALSNGLPVIATTHCGRVVEEGATGFLVPPRDPSALAQAIQRFVREPRLRVEMHAACQTAAAAYSVDAYGKRLRKIIARCQQHALSA